MPKSSIDPGSLEGDALTRWYLRSPAEIEHERQAEGARRYQDFFHGASTADPDPGFDRGARTFDRDMDPGFAVSPLSMSQDVEPGFTRAQAGPHRARSVKFATGSQSRNPTGGTADQTIAYGALRAPAPSNQELTELRRRQAAFAKTTRKIDLQNSWFAAPGLAAPLAVMALEGAAAWGVRTALPEIKQAPLQFVKRDPHLRVGDNWATRAGRRAQAALKERVMQKPGWDPERTIKLDDGRIIRPDVHTPPRIRGGKPEPEPYLMDLKPNTPSGLKAAARTVRKYEGLTGLKTRPLLYDPKPFI